MKAPIHTIEEYKAISGDVWLLFKKYFGQDYSVINTDDFTLDIVATQNKYNKNPRLYEFACHLTRLYMTEVKELKLLEEGIEVHGQRA